MNGWNSRLLAGILVLQVLILGALWKSGSTPAYGDGNAPPNQLPDNIGDLRVIADQLKDLNSKTDTLLDLLSSGNLQVQVKGADDNKAGK